MSVSNQTGITRERREQALSEATSYEAFFENAQVNKEELQANYEAYELSDEELSFLNGLNEPIDVLALAHDWCGDVVANLPLFGRISERTDKLKLRVLPRDPDNRDIADAYPHADGRSHIPTYLFYTRSGKELGVLIERPDSVTELLKQWIEDFWNERARALEGREKPIKDLEESARGELLRYIGRRRAEARDLEKTDILAEIKRIAGA